VSRHELGAADVTDGELLEIVARCFDAEPSAVEIRDCRVEPVAYEIPAITTAGRWWVRGAAAVRGQVRDYSLFVKQVQSWTRSPLFELIPPHLQQQAAEAAPWRTELLVYRSDLAARLPSGLSMPAVYGVYDLDELSGSVWLGEVPVVPRPWTLERLAHAAWLLGRLAASPRVRELAAIGEQERRRTVVDYYEGRFVNQVLPALHDDGVWRHPLVAGSFDAQLRRRMVAAADSLLPLVEELAALADGTAHGDACPNNLLSVATSDGFVLIDYAFWSTQPVGFDLSQLLLGEVQLGRCPAAALPAAESACLAAYGAGLRAEGCELSEEQVRRAHAIQMLEYSGLSAIPFELLDGEPTDETMRVSRERAAAAAFCLDLLDATR
jgi:hypothetical protein